MELGGLGCGPLAGDTLLMKNGSDTRPSSCGNSTQRGREPPLRLAMTWPRLVLTKRAAPDEHCRVMALTLDRVRARVEHGMTEQLHCAWS